MSLKYDLTTSQITTARGVPAESGGLFFVRAEPAQKTSRAALSHCSLSVRYPMLSHRLLNTALFVFAVVNHWKCWHLKSHVPVRNGRNANPSHSFYQLTLHIFRRS
jgi:hypothetical protein